MINAGPGYKSEGFFLKVINFLRVIIYLSDHMVRISILLFVIMIILLLSFTVLIFITCCATNLGRRANSNSSQSGSGHWTGCIFLDSYLLANIEIKLYLSIGDSSNFQRIFCFAHLTSDEDQNCETIICSKNDESYDKL